MFIKVCHVALVLTTVAGFLKKRHWHRCFPVNFTKFVTARFLDRTLPDTASTFRHFQINSEEEQPIQHNYLTLLMNTIYLKTLIHIEKVFK